MQNHFFENDFDNLDPFEKNELNVLKEKDEETIWFENKDKNARDEKVEIKLKTENQKSKIKNAIDLTNITPNYKEFIKTNDEFDFKKYISSGEPKSKQQQTDKVLLFFCNFLLMNMQ